MKLKSFAELKEALYTPPVESNPFYAAEPWNSHGVAYSKGWFFSDESYDIHGPYATEEKANEGLSFYCRVVLNGEPS